jgi:NADP-dependent 3-hydroxy acid dehydrogenase YdfG
MTSVAQISELGGEAIADGTNVTDRDQVDGMVARAIDRWRRIDILVNNAGILRDKTFAKMDLADFRLELTTSTTTEPPRTIRSASDTFFPPSASC